MNKPLKAAGAAIAGGVLLLGGAGSLAYWSDTATATGEDLSSGTLALGMPTGSWTLNGVDVDVTDVRLVPGDNLRYTGSVPVEATGDNLEGDLTVDWGTATTTLTGLTSTTTASFDGATLTDGNPTTFDATDDGKSVALAIIVDYPFGNTGEAGPAEPVTVGLDDITINLTQTDASPS